MKLLRLFFLIPFIATIFVSCSDDDDNSSQFEEVIVTGYTAKYNFYMDQDFASIVQATIYYLDSNSVEQTFTTTDTTFTLTQSGTTLPDTLGMAVKFSLRDGVTIDYDKKYSTRYSVGISCQSHDKYGKIVQEGWDESSSTGNGIDGRFLEQYISVIDFIEAVVEVKPSGYVVSSSHKWPFDRYNEE
ncbi:MAG: hypothetical protein K6E54_08030 [Bacteroidaceae bacterium]|nr:hypothetical protein [Bacteroidaceae bacterium]